MRKSIMNKLVLFVVTLTALVVLTGCFEVENMSLVAQLF